MARPRTAPSSRASTRPKSRGASSSRRSSTSSRSKATRRAPRYATGPQVISVRGYLTDEFPWGKVSASSVTPEVAKRVSSIFAVCRFIAQAAGVMPIRIRREPEGGRSENAVLPCNYTIKRRPNSWQTRFDFITLVTYWTALHGNGFARILPGSRGAFSSFVPLHPSRMKVEQLSDYSLRYQFMEESGKWTPYSQEEILHWRWLSDNGIWGMAPGEICATSISLARQLDIAATAFWRNRARPDMVIETQDKLDDDAIAQLREQFREMYGTENTGAPAVLPRKMQIKPIASNSMEANQFAQLRESVLPDTCRHWGVPSSLLGDTKGKSYATVEQETLAAQLWCLLPWQQRISGPFEMALQPVYGDEISVRLDNRGLLRGDSNARAIMYRALFSMGGLKPNELRDLEDFDLLDGEEADQTWMQLGFSTLANAAKGVASGAASSSSASSDGTDPVDSPSDPTSGRSNEGTQENQA